MTSRPVVLLTAVSVVVAACGGGDAEPTLTADQTTTVATTEAPGDELFAPADPNEPVDTPPVDSTPVGTEPVSTDVAITTPETDPEPLTSTTDSTTTTAPASTGPFTLEADGLGFTSFGADPVGTISFVSSFLGEPTDDTGWVDPFTIGPCGGTELRQVAWDDLRLEFGDSSSVTEGRQHFYAYTYGGEGSLGVVTPAGISTTEGISPGSSVADLLDAYPNVQLRSGDDFIAPNFFVNDNLTGRLSGLADDDVVELVIGGIPCEG